MKAMLKIGRLTSYLLTMFVCSQLGSPANAVCPSVPSKQRTEFYKPVIEEGGVLPGCNLHESQQVVWQFLKKKVEKHEGNLEAQFSYVWSQANLILKGNYPASAAEIDEIRNRIGHLSPIFREKFPNKQSYPTRLMGRLLEKYVDAPAESRAEEGQPTSSDEGVVHSRIAPAKRRASSDAESEDEMSSGNNTSSKDESVSSQESKRAKRDVKEKRKACKASFAL